MIDSPEAGFVAEDAIWRVEASDLPAFLGRWNALNTSKAMRRASPALHLALPLAIRQVTGVRPTPDRIRLWLGRTLLVSGGDDGWCLSVRPGVAMYLASWLGGPVRAGEEGDFWRDYVSAWKDGFLLVASSQTYLDKVLAAGKSLKRSNVPQDAVRISWEGSTPGALEIEAAEQIPVLFSLKVPAAPGSTLRYAAGWPDTLLTVNAHRGAPLVQAVRNGLRWMDGQLTPATAQATHSLIANWWSAYCPLSLESAPVDEWAAGVAAVNFQAEIPVVESIWAGWATDPSAILSQLPADRQEHRWDETTGWLLPVTGDARTWAIAEREGTTFLTSHENRMPALLATARREPEAGVAALNLSWKPFVGALRGLLLRAANEGLLPGYSEDDVQADWLPCVDAFADWGTLQLHANEVDGAIAGDGWIALGAELVP